MEARAAGRLTAPRGGITTSRDGGDGGDKAKVYESKGTPNYSYTIHD